MHSEDKPEEVLLSTTPQMPIFGGSSKDRRRLERAWQTAMQIEQGVAKSERPSLPAKLPTRNWFESLSEHPRIGFGVAFFSLTVACVLGYLAVRMKDPTPLLVAAWFFSIVTIIALCSLLHRYKKILGLLSIVGVSSFLYWIHHHYPSLPDLAPVVNHYGSSLVSNQGTIDSVKITDSSVDSTSPDGNGINIVHQPLHGNIAAVEMKDVHMFQGSRTWDQFMRGLEKHTGDANYLRASIEVMRLQMEDELRKIPASNEIKNICRTQFSSVAETISNHISDEKIALEPIRTNPPECFRPQ
jgi:hypothetical protein